MRCCEDGQESRRVSSEFKASFVSDENSLFGDLGWTLGDITHDQVILRCESKEEFEVSLATMGLEIGELKMKTDVFGDDYDVCELG